MTHHNCLGWQMPILQPHDIIDGGNLCRSAIPDIPLTFRNVNLKGCTGLTDKHTIIDCAVGEIIEYPEEATTYPELAARTELVLSALIASGKLSQPMIDGLTQLANGYKQVAGTQIELGLAATLEVEKMIDEARRLGQADLADQTAQALAMVQAIWETN